MGIFNCPIVNARLTSKFGWRDIGRGREFHQGVDLCDQTPGKKVPVYASASGKVIRVGRLGSYGNVVMIHHIINGKTYETNYAHLDSTKVKVGDRVNQGQQIGISGNTGGSFGIHLHFEVHNEAWATGQPNATDPMKWIELNTCAPLDSNVNSKVSQPQTRADYSKKIGYNVPQNSVAFRIHTDAYKSKSLAEKGKVDLVNRGYLKYAEVFGNDKTGYRVQSGKYSSQKDAETASKKLLDAKLIGYASIIGNLE